MEEAYSLHILFAIIGASLGGLKSLLKLFRKPNTNNALKTRASTLLFISEAAIDFIISIVLTVGFVNYYFDSKEVSVYTYLVSGIFIGFIGAYALEVFESIFPNIFSQLVRGLLFQFYGISISEREGDTENEEQTDKYPEQRTPRSREGRR